MHATYTGHPANHLHLPFSSSHLGQHDDTLLLELLNDQITHRRLPTRCGKGSWRADRTHACQLGTPTLEGTQPQLSRTGPARDADEKGLLPLAPSPAMRAAQSAVLTQQAAPCRRHDRARSRRGSVRGGVPCPSPAKTIPIHGESTGHVGMQVRLSLTDQPWEAPARCTLPGAVCFPAAPGDSGACVEYQAFKQAGDCF